MKITAFDPGGIPVSLSGWSTGVTSIDSNATVGAGGPNALNFVQLITANSSNSLPNPIVNFAAGSNIILSVNSNTLNIGSTASGSSGGGITSVALTVPAEFSVSGSPVTSSGTLAVTKATQSANVVWAGPTSGSAAAPAFRALVAADIPAGVGAVHEVVMVTSSAPPDPVLTSDGLDWVYSS